jgi:predicted O-linked N-acetylglucosamine transferase (SPINDLY family)
MHASLAPQTKFEQAAETKPLVLSKVVPLEDIDLSDELYGHYVAAKHMFEASANEPLNQRAQTINTVTAVLGRIAAIRTELYNSERIKKLEECLIRVLKDFPEVQTAFMDAYEEALNAV